MLVGTTAFAQESPELPAKAITGGEAETAATTLFYKGKGPGRGNSYVARYEEDYAYLRDPARAADWFDPFKFIPLNEAGDIYLTLNGEIRFRYDNTDHRNFAIATAAAAGRRLAGVHSCGRRQQQRTLQAALRLGRRPASRRPCPLLRRIDPRPTERA